MSGLPTLALETDPASSRSAPAGMCTIAARALIEDGAVGERRSRCHVHDHGRRRPEAHDDRERPVLHAMTEPHAPQRPWYREGWAVATHAAAVRVGRRRCRDALPRHHVPNPLVVDDYSRIEEINERTIRPRRDTPPSSASAPTSRSRRPPTDASTSTSRSKARAASRRRKRLTLRLQHVAKADADRQLRLERSGGKYFAATTLAVGRYDLEITPADASWRLAGPVPGVPSKAHLVPAAAAQPGG